jgi:hypothetical protein
MAHPASATDSEVFAALDRLEVSGMSLTPNRVRTELGGGNPKRYRDLIARWRVARALEQGPNSADGTSPTALFDEIVRTIEIGLYMRMGFLDTGFRLQAARDLASRIGGSLIRRGLASEAALREAPPDPFTGYIDQEDGGGS